MDSCSQTKHLEQKTEDSMAASLMEKIRTMTPEEKVMCRKYIRKLQKLTESEEAKERREAHRFMGIRLRNKIMKQKYRDTTKHARVKPYPQAEKKTETKNSEAGVSHCPEQPTHSNIFPIYSQGIVCGYFCTNENEMPPQKIALTNLRPATSLSPPNNLVQPPLIKLAQVTQVPRRTMEPVSASGNTLPVPQPVKTLSVTTMEKTMNGQQPLEPLNMVPIILTPVEIQHLIPTTIQSNNVGPSSGNLLCVTANNNQNDINISQPLPERVTCNVKKTNSCQQTCLKIENNNKNPVMSAYPGSFSSLGKHISDTGFQNFKQKCKLEKVEKVSVKIEPDTSLEKDFKHLESNFSQENCVSTTFSVPFPRIKTEFSDEDKQDCLSLETEQEKNDYGLVISSFFSLSKTNASEFGFSFENETL